jgi:ABC-type dipeptide/oligopeptide/nickel transport system permease subunit
MAGRVGTFLKENWVWIVAPVVVIALLLVIAIFVLGDGDVPFEYALF